MNIEKLYEIFQRYPKICTDSRRLTRDSLFFCLKGENFDGNKFAKDALKSGCRYAIIDNEEYQTKGSILVKNVLQTLQDLARLHREEINIPIIGITGTNGKTTTKELISRILSSKYATYATQGNLNSQIGVAISILEIKESHEIAVIEMGANREGEIKNLCEIAQPTEGIITNIGYAHLEGFGSIEGVIRTKTDLYRSIIKNNGIVFINSEDVLLLDLGKNNKQITYGNGKGSNYRADIINKFPFISIKIGSTVINSNMIGEFQYANILAACCIGNYFGVSLDNMKSSIEDYAPKNNRTEIVKTKNNYIILDAYNANPSSMNSMIDSFNQLRKNNKICILGEMKELGNFSKQEHRNIFLKMKELNIRTIYIGEEFMKHDYLDSFLNTEDFIQNITKYNLINKTILIKGSRSVRLERLIKYL